MNSKSPFAVRMSMIWMLLIIIIGLLFNLGCNLKNTENSLEFQDKRILKGIYPYIQNIYDGKIIITQISPGRPNEQGEHAYFYRFVETVYEVTDLLFLKRIGIFDKVGLDQRVTDHVQLDIGRIFPETDVGEWRKIKKVEWIDAYNAKLIIEGKEYFINVNDFL